MVPARSVRDTLAPFILAIALIQRQTHDPHQTNENTPGTFFFFFFFRDIYKSALSSLGF